MRNQKNHCLNKNNRNGRKGNRKERKGLFFLNYELFCRLVGFDLTQGA